MIETFIRNLKLMTQKEFQTDMKTDPGFIKEKKMAKIVSLIEQSDFPTDTE